MKFEGKPGAHNNNDGCKDVAIFAIIRDSSKRSPASRKTKYIREFENAVDDDALDKSDTGALNLTHLFLAVRAVASIQALKEFKLISTLGLKLGICISHATLFLSKVYESIFCRQQRDISLALEIFLLSKKEVCDAIIE